ncbi:MAG: hypothetical protein R3258_08270, partial [Acidimicrobiia bacterium]|nr:hypothetical protein [Acidimicrobiia bacterium]
LIVTCLVLTACTGEPPEGSQPDPQVTTTGGGTGSPPGDDVTTTTGGSVPVANFTAMRSSSTDFVGEGDQVISSVAVGGPGLVAVGWDTETRAAAVWTSTDGLAWSRVPHDEAIFGGNGSQWMFDVTAGGPGFVAVGASARLLSRTAVVWTSTDGISWTRVSDDQAFAGEEDYAEMRAVTTDGSTFVAVGMVGVQSPDAAVWTSPDGVAWTRVSDANGDLGGTLRQEMDAVTAGGPGFVAVGREFDIDSFEEDAAVWTSIDGAAWTRVVSDALSSEGDQRMYGVTAGGPGLVAVGLDWWVEIPPDAAVWVSPDGANWERVPHSEVFAGPSYQQMMAVTAGDHGVVAVGLSVHVPGEGSEATVWVSSDGVNWSLVPHDDASLGGESDQEMHYVVQFGDQLVAVGLSGPASDLDAAAWVLEGVD